MTTPRGDSTVPLSWKKRSKAKLVAIALIAVVLILVGILTSNAMTTEEVEEGYPSPKGKISIDRDDDGTFNITVVAMSVPLDVRVAEFFVINASGTILVSGNVKPIYCLNFDDENNNITFMDVDINGKITDGDYFLLRSAENGRKFPEGFRFVVKFTETDEVSMQAAEGEQPERDEDDEFDLFGYPGYPVMALVVGTVVAAAVIPVAYRWKRNHANESVEKEVRHSSDDAAIETVEGCDGIDNVR